MSFKKEREKSGLSQQAVAAKIGVDQSTVCLWETGKTRPRAKILPQIAALFGCTVDDLLSPESESREEVKPEVTT